MQGRPKHYLVRFPPQGPLRLAQAPQSKRPVSPPPRAIKFAALAKGIRVVTAIGAIERSGPRGICAPTREAIGPTDRPMLPRGASDHHMIPDRSIRETRKRHANAIPRVRASMVWPHTRQGQRLCPLRQPLSVRKSSTSGWAVLGAKDIRAQQHDLIQVELITGPRVLGKVAWSPAPTPV